MEPTALVAVLTVPTIAWLFGRFAFIVRKQYGHILFHLRRSISEATASLRTETNKTQRASTSSRWSPIALAAHIVLGLQLLSFAPYLAYLCIPPDHEMIEKHSETTLIVLAVALIVINSSVIWLVPHPKRHEEYSCSRREHVRAWTCLVVPATEFSAMALAALGVTVSSSMPLLRIVCVSLSVVLYIFCAVVCYKEVSNSAFPWEDTAWGKKIMQYATRGMPQKSKLIQAYVGGPPEGAVVILTCFLIPAILSILQNSAMVFNWVARPRTVPPGQEMFFVLFSLYTTLTMSAGFFSQAQLTFNMEKSKIKGDDGVSKRMNYMLICDVLLTQFLPICVIALGQHWTGHEDSKQYNIDWIFWTACS